MARRLVVLACCVAFFAGCGSLLGISDLPGLDAGAASDSSSDTSEGTFDSETGAADLGEAGDSAVSPKDAAADVVDVALPDASSGAPDSGPVPAEASPPAADAGLYYGPYDGSIEDNSNCPGSPDGGAGCLVCNGILSPWCVTEGACGAQQQFCGQRVVGGVEYGVCVAEGQCD